MIIFFVLCILQFATGSVIFREITSGTCSDYADWNHVDNFEQCKRIQAHIHLYKNKFPIPKTYYCREFEKVLAFQWERKLLDFSDYTLSFKKIYLENQLQNPNVPFGCYHFGNRIGSATYYNDDNSSTTECSVIMPCICVYTPPPGSYVNDFVSQNCMYDNTWVTSYQVDFDWPKLYDDTRTRKIEANCENNMASCLKQSLFAERRFQTQDITDIWDSENHNYIYDNLDNPIPLLRCNKGSVVNFNQFTTKCRKCPVGKYHDGDFTQNHACIECPSGKYNDQLGSTSCQTCQGEIQANRTLCTPCLSSNKIWDGNVCQSCLTGQKTLNGITCVPDAKYCAIGEMYDSGTCTSLPTQNVLTQSIDRFLNRTQSIPPGNDNEITSRMTKQIMKELVCDTMDLGYETRLAEKISGNKAILLPTIDVYPDYQICAGPTRFLKADEECHIEYEAEILDSFRFEITYLLAESKTDIYNSLSSRTSISVNNADCPSAMPVCSGARRTNCKCGTSVCKANEHTICDSGTCDYIGPEFRLSASQTSGLEHLSKDECEQFYNKYYEKYKSGRFIQAKILSITNYRHTITYTDNIGTLSVYTKSTRPVQKCKLKREDVIFGPDVNNGVIRSDNIGRKDYHIFDQSDKYVYKTTTPACTHNQLDSNCWCENSDYCMNKYCIFGKCEDSPLCESELGEARVSQDCICGDKTCDANQFCMNGQCLNYLFCPNGDGLENITVACQCGSNVSNVCTPGQACQNNECLPVPLCPNTNGLQIVENKCLCGSNVCSKDQHCKNGQCLDDSSCIGSANLRVLEPARCVCDSKRCSENEICFQGNCLPAVYLTCKTDGIHSYNMYCKCGDQTCGPSQFCYFNKCFDDPVCPFEMPFNGLCVNGVKSIYDSECRPAIFGYCSNSNLNTKAECEQNNMWGYCSNATISTKQECLKRCALDDYSSQKFNESNCQNERQLNIICNSEPCFVEKVPQYSDSGDYIDCLVGLNLSSITEQNCYTDNTILTCTDKQSGSPIIVSGDSLTSVEYERLKDMNVSMIDDIVRQNYENRYNETLLEGHPCLQEHEIFPENTWTDACTNSKIKTVAECRQTNVWNPGCSIEGIESPALCNSLTITRSERCSCNLFSETVEVCDKGEICIDNTCKDSLCVLDDFNPVEHHCKCGGSLCESGKVCHTDNTCRDLPLCGFLNADNGPEKNINCLCTIQEPCDSSNILEPCTAVSCNNQTQS